jgi:hypothetical protein
MCGTVTWKCEHCSTPQQTLYLCPSAQTTTISCQSFIPISLSNASITLPICNYCGIQHKSRPTRNIVSYHYKTESENKAHVPVPDQTSQSQPTSNPSTTSDSLKLPQPTSNSSTTSNDVQVPPANDPFWMKPSERLPDNTATLKRYNAARDDVLAGVESKQDTKHTSVADGASTQEQSVTDDAWRKLIEQIRRA